jgi:hypothetical protein
MGWAGGPWPTGAPGPDLKGQGPGHKIASPALVSRAKGQCMLKLALGLNLGRT